MSFNIIYRSSINLRIGMCIDISGDRSIIFPCRYQDQAIHNVPDFGTNPSMPTPSDFFFDVVGGCGVGSSNTVASDDVVALRLTVGGLHKI